MISLIITITFAVLFVELAITYITKPNTDNIEGIISFIVLNGLLAILFTSIYQLLGGKI